MHIFYKKNLNTQEILQMVNETSPDKGSADTISHVSVQNYDSEDNFV